MLKCSLCLALPLSTMKAAAVLFFGARDSKRKSNEKLIAHVNSTGSFITRLLTVNIMRKLPLSLLKFPLAYEI